ncbi:DEAD/DEAH box helicase [Staphylococcus sp. IVB6246]|uniref:DEAD/DEAH box helicase n=1 Tax=Staphylococcus sp. IVB6246 TaxID=2989772 RepID=UPI0021D07009|nr:DEAD/DEAH box helicase [Staphylococcus sp. IVB6246]UXR70273.1 DEAD/DEAH box helicase [Staphylococcus sp. IVB6246]
MSEVARRATNKGNKVLFCVHRIELVNQIKNTFRLNNVDMDLCHVGMVQTIKNRVKRGAEPEPSIILVDEAHHSLAKTYLDIFEAFPDAYVFGFSATPCRLNGRGFTDVFTDLIPGKTVKWLIDNKRLAPFKYYSVNLLDANQLKTASTGDYRADSITNAMKTTIYGDAVENYKKFADGKKTIIYTHNVESSKQVAEKFNQSGYKALQVDGKTSKTERDAAMQAFRNNEVNILVNAELYGEGVDVPDCHCVILLRPTKSLTLFIQQTMRAMRYQPNKTAIIIDHVGNYMRHGLPNTEHDWQIHFKGRKKKRSKENTIMAKECPECLSVIPAAHSECPYCGYEWPPLEREDYKVDENAELEEVGSSFVLEMRKPEDCKSVEELYEVARNLGYKPGWAYVQAKRLGMLG